MTRSCFKQKETIEYVTKTVDGWLHKFELGSGDDIFNGRECYYAMITSERVSCPRDMERKIKYFSSLSEATAFFNKLISKIGDSN